MPVPGGTLDSMNSRFASEVRDLYDRALSRLDRAASKRQEFAQCWARYISEVGAGTPAPLGERGWNLEVPPAPTWRGMTVLLDLYAEPRHRPSDRSPSAAVLRERPRGQAAGSYYEVVIDDAAGQPSVTTRPAWCSTRS